MIPALAELLGAGALAPLDVALAARLARLCGGAPREVRLALAMASRQVRQGHVCLDIQRWLDTPVAALCDDDAQAASFRWPDRADVLRALRDSPLVCGVDTPDHAPLVLEADQRLYLARYYDHQRALAARLRALASAPAHDAAPPAEALGRLFPDAQANAQQRLAAERAFQRRLCVVSGGPGTGKTSTVVRLLALLIEQALDAGAPPPRCLLTAPTGKAAARLSESIRAARQRLATRDAVRAAVPDATHTVHRALGPLRDSSTRFRHGPERPLECDLLLVDEASMVDLALMRRLLDAVPHGARVILLGDRDQLASVEAGAVLGDVCEAAGRPGSPLADCVVQLRETHRYAPGSGIALLAEAIRAGDAEAALRVLRDPARRDVALGEPLTGALPAGLAEDARRGYAGLASADPAARLEALGAFRILCAHRAGPGGVSTLNAAVERALGLRRRDGDGEHYAGQPLLVTENDYTAQLFNGDVGVVHREGRGGQLVACFPTAEGAHRQVALARLPTHESVYAMSVHKSQGSELDRVAVVLPDRPSPVLSRELLYTAVTRARSSVTVYASEAVLRACVAARVQRASGLVEALAAPASAPAPGAAR